MSSQYPQVQTRPLPPRPAASAMAPADGCAGLRVACHPLFPPARPALSPHFAADATIPAIQTKIQATRSPRAGMPPPCTPLF